MQLAEKMRQKLLATGSNSQSNSNDEETVSKQDMQDWLLIVGIASPVTKETAGALYHQQLSRQVHVEFFSPQKENNHITVAACHILNKLTIQCVLEIYSV